MDETKRDEAPESAKTDEARQCPAIKKITIDGITFSSDFDSGNLGKVERDDRGRFRVWPALDCQGTEHQRKSCSWWHFSVRGGEPNQTIRIVMMSVGKAIAMYKRGMRPVARRGPRGKWARLRTPVAYKEVEGSKGKLWTVEFTCTLPGPKKKDARRRKSAKQEEESNNGWANIETYFAFCFPYSYEECQEELAKVEEEYGISAADTQKVAQAKKSNIYFSREHLINSVEGRRVDLLTITDFDGYEHSAQTEPFINDRLFPDRSKPRPTMFLYRGGGNNDDVTEEGTKGDDGGSPSANQGSRDGKETVFISARVHPGETPGQFAFLGLLRLLLDAADPRARALRRRYVFRLVPMLNPDGVFHGHTRHDTLGQNLNRHYTTPDPDTAPAIFAVREVMHYLKRHCALTAYFDCHAHASKRGCFIYGNQLDDVGQQIDNQLVAMLMALNTQHFEYDACNFSKDHMNRVDPGDDGLPATGTGRVGFHLQLGLVRSYTLECNYATGKKLNELAAMTNAHLPDAPQSLHPPKYLPEHWRDVGRSFLLALLDAEGINPQSRLLNHKFRTLDRVKQFLYLTLKRDPLYSEAPYPFQKRSGVPAQPPPGGRRRSSNKPAPRDIGGSEAGGEGLLMTQKHVAPRIGSGGLDRSGPTKSALERSRATSSQSLDHLRGGGGKAAAGGGGPAAAAAAGAGTPPPPGRGGGGGAGGAPGRRRSRAAEELLRRKNIPISSRHPGPVIEISPRSKLPKPPGGAAAAARRRVPLQLSSTSARGTPTGIARTRHHRGRGGGCSGKGSGGRPAVGQGGTVGEKLGGGGGRATVPPPPKVAEGGQQGSGGLPLVLLGSPLTKKVGDGLSSSPCHAGKAASPETGSQKSQGS